MSAIDLLDPRLARRYRARATGLGHATATYDDERRPGRRQHLTDRLNSHLLLCRLAWAEIAGLHPEVTYRLASDPSQARTVRPWRDGPASALAYLNESLGDVTGRALARRSLAVLERRGLVEQIAQGAKPVYGLTRAGERPAGTGD